MLLEDFIELLGKFDPKMPVYIGVWVDRHPLDGDGTDLSCYEPYLLTDNMIQERNANHGIDRKIEEPHLYIIGDWYYI